MVEGEEMEEKSVQGDTAHKFRMYEGY